MRKGAWIVDEDVLLAEFPEFCGQLAGAYWGESGIPVEWREGLARPEMIEKALQRS